jgi:hypothetical protein
MSKPEKPSAESQISRHWRLFGAGLVGVFAWGGAHLNAPRRSLAPADRLGSAPSAISALTWRLFLTADETEVRSMAAREDEKSLGSADDRAGRHPVASLWRWSTP